MWSSFVRGRLVQTKWASFTVLSLIGLSCLGRWDSTRLAFADDGLVQPISRLKAPLVEELKLDPRQIRLNWPPSQEISLGSIVVVEAGGKVTVIEKPEPAMFAIVASTPRDEWLNEEAILPPENSLLGELFASVPLHKSPIRVSMSTSSVRLDSLRVKDDGALRKLILSSAAIANAIENKRDPLLVNRIYRGTVNFDIRAEESLENDLVTKLPGFEIKRDVETKKHLSIFAKEPLVFAFSAERLRIEPAIIDTEPPLASWGPSLQPLELASEWEKAPKQPLMEATGEGYETTVFYVTDRKIKTAAGEQEKFWTHFGKFFRQFWGLASTVVIVIVALIVLFGPQKPSLGWRMIFAMCILLVVPVMAYAYAMNKMPTSPPDVFIGFTGDASDTGDLLYGTCKVSIPKDHRMGRLERPRTILVYELPEDAKKHVVVKVINPPVEEKDFYSDLNAHLGECAKKEAFVFVHGYNNTFDDAARRTAQIWYDLKFEGAPIFYSWPSQGIDFSYPNDEQNSEWTQPHFTAFLSDLAKKSDAKRIYVIAHSMGNRVVTRGFQSLGASELENPTSPYREILLGAPDVYTRLFVQQLAPALAKKVPRVTIYASSNDEALKLSHTLHEEPRVGDAGEDGKDLVVFGGIETIDVSALDTSFDSHAYFASHDSVITDIFNIIHHGSSPDQRIKLQPRVKDGVRYWIFPPEKNSR